MGSAAKQGADREWDDALDKKIKKKMMKGLEEDDDE
jgi:hypothetical protein